MFHRFRINYTLTMSEAYPLLIGHDEGHSDAGFDMRSPVNLIIAPGEHVGIDTGIIIELPKDSRRWKWEAQIRPRSSMRKIGVIASLGTIDAGYRGVIGCIIHNHSDRPYVVERGDKICQLVVQRLPRVDWNLVRPEELDMDTKRGAKRYGSTGK